MSAPAMDRESIKAIWMRLEVDGRPSLFLMTALDGSINRQGSGSAETRDNDLFIGMATPDVFVGLRAQATPKLLEWCGQSLGDPQPKGKVCRLTIGFVLEDGTETATGWQYGTESQGPPPEVCDYVRAAVAATQPWHDQQKAMVTGAKGVIKRPWWRFWG